MRVSLNGLIASTCLLAALAAPALASEMRYTPLNPSFGGNPFNSSHFLSKASAQNSHERPTPTTDPVAQFNSTIASTALSRLAYQISDQIFANTPGQPNGQIQLGNNQFIQYTKDFSTNTVTVQVVSNGQVTTSIGGVPLNPAQ